jgi:Fe-S-cluster containining protein
MRAQYQIININLTSVTNDEPIADVPCGNCVLCCEQLAPYLTPAEVSSGVYPISLTQPSPEQLAENPQVGPIVTIFRNKSGGCGLFVDGACSIYDFRPLACRQFDCRKQHHPRIPNMLKDQSE